MSRNKNLIYIVAIDDPNKEIKCQDYAEYSILTWEYWCKKNNVDLLVLRENEGQMKFPIWNKELIWDFGQGYEKIGIVDSDTMVRWDTPNIFDLYNDDEFCGVNDLCDLNWLFSSIEQRQRFFPEVNLDINKYLNAGILFFSKKHLSLWKEFHNWYLDNQTEVDELKTGGKEQTFLNMFLQSNNVNIKLLDPCWNLLSIHRKNMFQHNWQLKVNPLPYFMKYAYIWHFTGFPIEQRVQVMKDTWNYIKEKYEID